MKAISSFSETDKIYEDFHLKCLNAWWMHDGPCFWEEMSWNPNVSLREWRITSSQREEKKGEKEKKKKRKERGDWQNTTSQIEKERKTREVHNWTQARKGDLGQLVWGAFKLICLLGMTVWVTQLAFAISFLEGQWLLGNPL